MAEETLFSGFLFKQKNNLMRTWQRKWSVLSLSPDDGKAALYMYDNKESKEGTVNKKTLSVDQSSHIEIVKNRTKDHYFEITTDAKTQGFAAENKHELERWVAHLRHVASGGAKRPVSEQPSEFNHPSRELNLRNSVTSAPSTKYTGQENVAYSSYEKTSFQVTIKPLEKASELKLHGDYKLVLDSVNIALVDLESSKTLHVWPYKYLRRYGRDRTMFSFEAGRRCDSGPGVFEFSTYEGNDIFFTVDNSVRELKGLPPNPRDPPPGEPPGGYTHPQAVPTGGYTGLQSQTSHISTSPSGSQVPGVPPQRSLPPVPAGLAVPTQSPDMKARPVSHIAAELEQSGAFRRQSDPGTKKKPPVPSKPVGAQKNIKGPDSKDITYAETKDKQGAWKNEGRMTNIHLESTFNPDQEDYAVPKGAATLEDTYEEAILEGKPAMAILSAEYDHLELNPMKKKQSTPASDNLSSPYDTLEGISSQNAGQLQTLDDYEGQYETVRQSARGTMDPIDLQQDEEGYFTHTKLSQSQSVPAPSFDIRTTDDNPYDYASVHITGNRQAFNDGFKTYDEIK
ncbi:docking protein 1-like [Ptychodera flava]|uniref:docking protein 1-like n=1 Tax=Ptychodera flava TaxID=63121 RepID=UPI00396A9DD0